MSDLVKRLREAYGEVACFPENKSDGFMLLLALRNIVPEAADRIEQLERELALQNRLTQDAHDGWKIAHDQLAEDKSLADELEKVAHGVSWDHPARAAYRKARGL